MKPRKLDPFGVTLHHRTVKNGVPLFLFHRKGMPLTIRALFLAGCRFDAISGTAHFLEHMLCATSSISKSKDVMARKIENIGGVFGCSTGLDFIRCTIEVPEANDLPQGIATLAEIIADLRLPKHVLETERGSILAEIKNDVSSPDSAIGELSWANTFAGTGIEHPTLGTEKTVRSITAADLRVHSRTYVTTGRTCYVVSGDASPDTLAKLLEKIAIPSGERHVTLPPTPSTNRTQPIAFALYPTSRQAEIRLMFRVCDEFHADSHVLDIIAATLGSGRSSILASELRYKRGLVYSVGARKSGGMGWGTFTVSVSCSPEHAQTVIDIIVKELHRVIRGSITADRLQFEKNSFRKSKIRGMQTSGSWLGHDAECFFRGTNLETILDYEKKIEQITTKNIRDVAARYFLPDAWHLTVCGPISTKNVLVHYTGSGK